MRNYVKKIIILCLCISVLGTYVPLTASANAVKAAVNEDTENPSTPEEPTEPEEPDQSMLPVLTGKLSASQTVTLQWISQEEGNIYLLSRATSKTGTYEILTSITSICGTQSYKDTHLSLGKTYYYKLSLVANNSSIYESNTLSIKVRLLSPSNVTTSVSSANDVTLTWKKVSNASGYTIYRSTSRTGTYTKLKSTTKKSAYDNGNEIANHTYSHPTLTKLNLSNVKSQISKTDSAVKKVTGEATSLVRAPGGATNTSVRNAIDKPFIYWSIDTLDWKHRNKQTTINTVMKNIKDGDIILMHDIHKPSKEAALELIPKLKKAGYQLVTVEELAEYQGYTMKDHTTYYSFR